MINSSQPLVMKLPVKLSRPSATGRSLSLGLLDVGLKIELHLKLNKSLILYPYKGLHNPDTHGLVTLANCYLQSTATFYGSCDFSCIFQRVVTALYWHCL